VEGGGVGKDFIRLETLAVELAVRGAVVCSTAGAHNSKVFVVISL